MAGPSRDRGTGQAWPVLVLPVASGITVGLVGALLGVGLVGYLVVVFGSATATAVVAGRRRRHVARGWRLAAGVAALGLLWWVAGPHGARRPPEPVPAGHRLTLDDGTHLAYDVLGDDIDVAPAPVIFVHGGPGVSTRSADRDALSDLADQRPVVVYDQIGTGASSRLDDPTGYTLHRALADLDALHAGLGIEQAVLIGHSWGGTVAARYAATHPDRVRALVLAAPGSLTLDPAVADDPTLRLTSRQRVDVYGALLRPRELFTYGLTVLDPRLAHDVTGDAEMDRRFAAILARIAPGLFCDPANAGRQPVDGTGHYAHQLPQILPSRPPPLPPDVNVPALVVKPECDYLPWSTVEPYVDRFDADVVVLSDAGHALHLERPQAFTDLVTSFLAGETLEGQVTPTGGRPDAFDGPP